MRMKSFINGIRTFLAELTEEGSNYIALFVGILLWAITQSVWVGVVSGVACAFILFFLIDKTIRPKEESANEQPRKQYPSWVLLLFLLATIAVGSLIAYFVAN